MREQLNDKQLAIDITSNFQNAEIDNTNKAILEFAVKVTEAAHTITPKDLVLLRDFGLSDEALFAIVEIVGFFCYVNRLADAFGVKLDDFLEQRWSSEFDR